MKNRAKCKKCKSIIESFHSTDYVVCSCGEIAVDGGDSMRCFSNSWDNFVRVDDEGNEIVPEIIDDFIPVEERRSKPSKKELLEMLDSLITSYEKLPSSALSSPASNSDLHSALLILSSLIKSL